MGRVRRFFHTPKPSSLLWIFSNFIEASKHSFNDYSNIWIAINAIRENNNLISPLKKCAEVTVLKILSLAPTKVWFGSSRLQWTQRDSMSLLEYWPLSVAVFCVHLLYSSSCNSQKLAAEQEVRRNGPFHHSTYQTFPPPPPPPLKLSWAGCRSVPPGTL